MNSKKFVEVYTSFCAHHSEKNYKAVVEAIVNIPTTDLIPKYAQYYSTICLRSLGALGKTSSKCATRLKHICQAFEYLWKLQPDLADVLKTISQLNSIQADAIGNNHASKLLSDIIYIFKYETHALDPEKHFSAVCQCVLVFVTIEAANNLTEFAYTERLLGVLKNGVPKDSVYYGMFKHMLSAVMVCQRKKSSDDIRLKSFKAPLPAHEIDTVITIALILTSCKRTYEKSLSTLSALVRIQCLLLRNTEPTHSRIICCFFCQKNLLVHTALALAHDAFTLILEFMTADRKFDADSTDSIIQELIALRSLDCPNRTYYEQVAKHHVTRLATYTKPQTAAVVLRFIEQMCAHSQSIADGLDAYLSADEIIRYLFQCHQHNDTPSVEAVRVNYLRVISLLTSDEYPGPAVDQHMSSALWRLCKWENLVEQEQLFDFDVYLESIDYKYRDAVPIKRVNALRLRLLILQFASIHPATLSDAKQLQLINQLFRAYGTNSANGNAHVLDLLRISNTFQMVPMPGNVYERLRALFAAAKRDQKQLIGQHNKYRWYSIVANMEYLEYMHGYTEVVDRHRSTSFEFKDAEQFRGYNAENLSAEVALVRRLQSALVWYTELAAKLSANACKYEYAWETYFALESLRRIGEHFSVRLYRDDAMRAYRILHALGRKVGDEFAQLHAVSYISAYTREYLDKDSEQNLADLLDQAKAILATMIAKRAALSRRKQSIMLRTLMNIGLSYVGAGDVAGGKQLISYAETMMGQTEQQFAQTDGGLLRIRYNAVLLALITRHGLQCPFPPILFAESITRSCVRLKAISVEEMITLPTLLFETMWEVIRYSMARYDIGEVEPVLGLLLKLSARNGCAYKTAKVLAMWAQVELFKEKDIGCEQKLSVLDDLLPLFNNQTRDTIICKNVMPVPPVHLAAISPVRNVQKIPRISPIRELRGGQNVSFRKYLIDDHPPKCDCLFCKKPMYNHLLFEVATIYCRSFYIKSEFAHSLRAFDEMHTYYKQHQSSKYDPQSLVGWAADELALAIYRMFAYFGQSLWRDRQFDRALDMLRQAGTHLGGIQDAAIKQDLLVQCETVQMEREMALSGIDCKDMYRDLKTTFADSVGTIDRTADADAAAKTDPVSNGSSSSNANANKTYKPVAVAVQVAAAKTSTAQAKSRVLLKSRENTVLTDDKAKTPPTVRATTATKRDRENHVDQNNPSRIAKPTATIHGGDISHPPSGRSAPKVSAVTQTKPTKSRRAAVEPTAKKETTTAAATKSRLKVAANEAASSGTDAPARVTRLRAKPPV